MNILGIHGFIKDHDASAALLMDGHLVSFVEEERFNRIRHSWNKFPHGAVGAVLAEGSITLEDVDVVAFGYEAPSFFTDDLGIQWSLSDAEFISYVTGQVPAKVPALQWIRHHEAHAASAYYCSGFDDASIVVVDGKGEWESSTIYKGSRGAFKRLRMWGPHQSIGHMYDAVTALCGFGDVNCGKTMGLASYDTEATWTLPFHWTGDDIEVPIPADVRFAHGKGKDWHTIIHRLYGLHDTSMRNGGPHDDLSSHHPALAGAGQRASEEVMRGITAHTVARTGYRRLCIAGGVGLNCVTNGLLLDLCDEIYVQPAANDAGVSLGAALAVAVEHGEPVEPMPAATVGTGYSDSEIADAIGDAGGLPVSRTEDPADEAVKRITGGQIVGWFQGRMEVGPRALGSRSILALPGDPSMKDRVNLAKGRELWRPLAPSLLREEMVRVFARDIDCPFMLVSLPLTAWALENLPSIAHVDGTARPQSVDADGTRYRALLEKMRAATGAGVVLNTSFNEPGQPIVRTPQEALGAFARLGLDALVIGSTVVVKEKARIGYGARA